MAIRGALFDCDGTLIDSMPMWHRVTVELLAAHDVNDPENVFAKTEPLPLHEMCASFCDDFGVDSTEDALFEELMVRVRDAYAHRVELLPGCREFLGDLSAHGVRMAVCSSTSVPEVELALEAQGIRGFFQDVISTGGSVRSKEYPDVWEKGLASLGTAAGETWVFEDAPFGMRSARQAGLHTVCLFSPHGDRDIDECSRLGDILVHGYPELSFALLEDYALPVPGFGSGSDPSPDAAPLRALVVDGSPEPSSAGLVRSLARDADYVIAADAGAMVLREAGVVPDAFCGDCDSVEPTAGDWARSVSRVSYELPREKYATDLAYAIACARNEAARQGRPLALDVTCATGGRPDHALAVMGQLLGAADARPRLVEDGFEARVLCPEGADEWGLGGDAKGRTFSLIALRDSIVSESGMRWNLDRRTLPALSDEGVSNVVAEGGAHIHCHEGVVMAFLL